MKNPIAKTMDGLKNLFTGLGTTSTKRGNNFFTLNDFISHEELDAIYRDTWLGKQIVDVPAKDAVREGRRFICQDAEDIQKESDRLNVLGFVQEAYSWSRLYGGSIMLMVTDQDLEKPLNLNKIKRGSLKKLIVFERFELNTPTTNLTDPLADNYLLPEFYQITSKGSVKIHWSHVVRFSGEQLPRRLRFNQQGWGDSTLRKIMEDLADVIASKSGMAELFQEANVDVIKREGLANELASDEEGRITARFDVFRKMKSIFRLALLDGAEEYDRHQISFLGMADAMAELRVWISGAADIPVTRLFGESAKGLSATGEGDQNNYYDGIKSLQNSDLRQALTVLDQVMVRSALGHFPEDCEFEWNPLVQQSGIEQAQEDLVNAQVDRMYLDDGIINEVHIARRLQQQNRYGLTDEEIDQLEIDIEEDDEDLDDEFDISESGSGEANPGERGSPAESEEAEEESET